MMATCHNEALLLALGPTQAAQGKRRLKEKNASMVLYLFMLQSPNHKRICNILHKTDSDRQGFGDIKPWGNHNHAVLQHSTGRASSRPSALSSSCKASRLRLVRLCLIHLLLCLAATAASPIDLLSIAHLLYFHLPWCAISLHRKRSLQHCLSRTTEVLRSGGRMWYREVQTWEQIQDIGLMAITNSPVVN